MSAKRYSAPTSSVDVQTEAQIVLATDHGRCIRPTNPFVEFKKDEVEQSIPARFEQQVAKYPHRIAVKTRQYALTYEELNKAANRVARAILARRGEGEEPIAILLEHQAPMMAAILGVLKAGKIYVPLDPSSPEARATYIVDDSQSGLIVTNDRHFSKAHELSSGECQPLNIDELDSNLCIQNVGLNISPDRLAYIRYTSGSTGRPKGVMEKHRNLLHMIMRQTNDFHLCAFDRLTFLGSWGKHIFRGLLNGAALYPANVKEQGLAYLAKCLAEEDITIYHSTATVFRHFVDTLTGEEVFPSLRLVRLAGDPVCRRDVELYKRHFSPQCIFVNELGSTEVGSIARYFIDKGTDIVSDIVPVGYPVEDIKVLLLDDQGKQVFPNDIGQIAVKSRYLSPGYWRKPELTRAAFLPDPHGGDERIYLTGDLGLTHPQGYLLHLGRKDSQIKIRGNRVELAEVEMALLDLDVIKETVVVAHEDPTNDKRLVAYIVPFETPPPTASMLRRALVEKLPEYMVPSVFVFLHALPLTPTGKVDRRALPKPQQMRSELEKPFIEPRDGLELKLTQMWERVLGVQPIEPKDNFFDLGGDSLLAVCLVADIEKTLGTVVPLPILFQAPTIEQLASILREGRGAASSSSLVVVQPDGSKPPFFCAHGCYGYIHLARYLGPVQPFYGLAQHLNGKQIRGFTVEDIAAHYLQEIRTLQPQGPYCLGGHSFGGLVAFEIAQQLRQQGHQVALLALFDPIGPGVSSSLAKYAQEGLQQQIKRIFKSACCRMCHLTGIHPPGDLQSFYLDKVVYGRVYPEARTLYVPRAYPGRITIFKAEGTSCDPQLWSRLAIGGLEIHAVPGNHHSMLVEPHVSTVAKQLNECLDQAQTNSLKQTDMGVVYYPPNLIGIAMNSTTPN